MSETNKSLRIKANVGEDSYVNVHLDQDYDVFEILSLKIKSVDAYKLHNANYGVVVGRVLANNGFGIPNAKISIFVEHDNSDSETIASYYPYTTPRDKREGIRYNLLPDNQVDDCHQIVGTFPNKTYLLDNDVLLEVFDKYYKLTTRTNNSGDYLIMGVPTGNQTIHMDLDLSDCGILSQRPRDFVYKGYTIEQFENPNQFKTEKDLDMLSQIFSQDVVVNVIPFWGNNSNGSDLGLTRQDINVAFKFEPTCVFIGSVGGDNASNGISKRCVPTGEMGAMDEMVTGEGTIEMIRKTIDGSIESFAIKGNTLINSDGVWCYQIPMNLDYMITDEYGNMVPTDDTERGIPTRARVRFRVSMTDSSKSADNYYRAKVLVPHNPQVSKVVSGNKASAKVQDYDYEFGSNTREDSFRDLFWNNVYSVKSYIPRFQRKSVYGIGGTDKFTGIKHTNIHGANNSMPYNNIRIKLPLMFTLLCALIKSYIRIVDFVNQAITRIAQFLGRLAQSGLFTKSQRVSFGEWLQDIQYVVLSDGLCPDLEGWYFAPNALDNYTGNNELGTNFGVKYSRSWNLMSQTYNAICKSDGEHDSKSIDENNKSKNNGVCLTMEIDYLVSCIEMNLAQEYKVINFDFYNDWVNGFLYFPRWMRYYRPKKTYLWGAITVEEKVKGCMTDPKIYSTARWYTQQCGVEYTKKSTAISNVRFYNAAKATKSGNTIHKGYVHTGVFSQGGVVEAKKTYKGETVYYLKPCEVKSVNSLTRKINLFATDVILLGSLNDCDLNGIPMAFKGLPGSSYIMPTNLAHTNMEDSSSFYSTSAGTICASKYWETGTGDTKGLHSNGNASLSGEAKYLNSMEGYNNNNNNEKTDTIAITEAAGISWNYTGPQQGGVSEENIDNYLYYPGGHFLGLTCNNSQTNLKTCINLGRICEVGSAMSQRKEIYMPNSASETGKYAYLVPTGFIGQDEIIDESVRSMFATMNNKPLIATRTDEKTGYLTYDFTYMGENGFDGAISHIIHNNSVNNPYNTRVNVIDESSTLNSKYGVTSYDRTDYDDTETSNTYRRTIEMPVMDYYRFRMGVTYNDLYNLTQSVSSAPNLIAKYASGGTTDSSSVMLPQYENSFYFYFGLHDGATAIDEFNNQFFSDCGSKDSVLKNKGEVYVKVENIDIRENKGAVTVEINNMEEPYTIIFNGAKFSETLKDVTNNVVRNHVLPFDTYSIDVIDMYGNKASTSVSLGQNLCTFEEIKGVEFNTSTKTLALNTNDGRLNGGFIYIKSPRISGSTYVNGAEGEIDDGEINIVKNGLIVGHGVMDNDENIFYVPEANASYDVVFKCVYFEETVATVTVNSSLGMDLYVNGISFNSTIIPKYFTSSGDDWWRNLSTVMEPDSPNSWKIRKSLFRNIDEDGSKTVNINVTVSGGTKWLYGHPQNSEGFFHATGEDKSQELCKSDDIIHMPSSYAVTDEAAYYATYYSNPRNNDFYAAVVNGTLVGTSPYGTIDRYSGNWLDVERCTTNVIFGAPSIPNGDLNPIESYTMKDGSLCIFKVMDMDDYSYELYVTTFHKDSERSYIDNPLSNKAKTVSGIIYPMLYYPSLRRPYYANADFFTWKEEQLVPSVEMGSLTITDGYYDGGKRYEIEIHNGAVLCTPIGPAISGVAWDTVISGIVYTAKRDLDGIDSNTDRIIGTSGHTILSGKVSTSAEYLFSEVFDANNVGDTINGAVNAIFRENISYAYNGSNCAFYGNGTVEEDENVKYYVATLNDTDYKSVYGTTVTTVGGEKKYPKNTNDIYRIVNGTNAYVSCKYKEGNGVDTTATVMAEIYHKTVAGDWAYWIKYDNGSGNIEEVLLYTDTAHVFNDGTMAKLLSNMRSLPDCKVIPRTDVRINGATSWKGVFDEDNMQEIKLGGEPNNVTMTDNSLIVGIAYGNSESSVSAKTRFVCLYPNASGVQDFTIGEALYINMNEGTTLEMGAGKESKSFSISANTTWSSESNTEWLNITPENATSLGNTNVILSASKNLLESDRTGKITIASRDGSVVKEITVQQRHFFIDPQFDMGGRTKQIGEGETIVNVIVDTNSVWCMSMPNYITCLSAECDNINSDNINDNIGQSGLTELTFKVAANYGDLRTGTISFKMSANFDDSCLYETKTISIIQSGIFTDEIKALSYYGRVADENNVSLGGVSVKMGTDVITTSATYGVWGFDGNYGRSTITFSKEGYNPIGVVADELIKGNTITLTTKTNSTDGN